jgi:SAM-dependent methyltransferase
VGAVSCPICAGADAPVAFEYTEPPDGETAFELPPGQDYRRAYRRCARCGHFFAETDIDLDAALYGGAYVDATYGEAMVRAYERIMALPPEQSDNAQRVRRIDGWWAEHRPGMERALLDVGSGLGVFGARMKELGWDCTVLDPDPRTVAFSRERIGVEAIEADFFDAAPERRYPLVTLNKVLEHVSDPAAMLARTLDFLEPGGAVYVEVPDGEAAARDPDGQGREEFFVEHLHVFSPRSLELLAERAGFAAQDAASIREPSGKHTALAFIAR